MEETTKTTAATPEGGGNTNPTSKTEEGTPVSPPLGDRAEDAKKPEDDAPGSLLSGAREKAKTGEGEEGGEKTETPPVTAEDLKIPEGYEYDKDLGESFLGVLNDPKLTRQELGQKLLEMYTAQQAKMLEGEQAASNARSEQWKREEAEWFNACKTDQEFGGAAFEANRVIIERGAARLATPECVKVLEALGVGSHPEIVRMFYRAGKLVGEDRLGGAKSASTPIDTAEAIFGESLKGQKMKGDNE